MDVSSIADVTNSGLLSNGTKVTTSGGSNFDMEDFFKLLAAQLQYQDPSSSTSNDQYMQEMAQFSTVEAIQNLVKIENYSMASGVVGKNVSYDAINTDSNGKYVTVSVNGKVEAVDFSSETPKYYVTSTAGDGTVSSNWIDYSDIKRIYSSDVELNSKTSTDTTNSL